MLMDILKKPFPQIMRELVLDPLGMEHSPYEQPLPDKRARFAATARPSDLRPVDGKWHVYPEMAAAGLWTTPTDLARFALEMQLAREGKSYKVLSAETVNLMLTPQVEEHIGLGFFLSGKDDSVRFGHGGWDEGFLAMLTAYKHRGSGMAVMLNSNRGWPVMDEILRAVAEEYGWPDIISAEPPLAEIDLQMYMAYVGKYEFKPDFHFTVAQNGSGLTLQPTGQAALDICPESDTKFFARIVEAKITFVKTEAVEVKELTCKQNGKEMSAKRLDE